MRKFDLRVPGDCDALIGHLCILPGTRVTLEADASVPVGLVLLDGNILRMSPALVEVFNEHIESQGHAPIAVGEHEMN